MDRKKAQSLIGKSVKVDDGQAGSYCAILKEIKAEPRKPWSGVVQIQSVLDLPFFEESTNQLPILHLKEGQLLECVGSKLTSLSEQDIPESYEKSLIKAAQVRMKDLQLELRAYHEKEKSLLIYLENFGVNVNTTELYQIDEESDSSIVYTFHYDGDHYILIDEQDERLDLQDCPFKISWKYKGQLFTGIYETNGSFLSDCRVRYTPKEGAVFTISSDQFDPYVILRNELEPAALISLEKNLAHLNLTHDDLIDCHNSLLSQLLDADDQKSFNGVNFLTFDGREGIVLVQHHYERELHQYKNDKVYDRFEFTTEQGKRSIVTYTNEYSM